MCHRPGTFSFMEIGALTACARHIDLLGNILFCLGLEVYFFVLLNVYAYGTWPNPLLCRFLVGRVGCPSSAAWEGCVWMISLCQLQGNMHWPQRTDNIETDLALSFFFMTKMLSHPVLCVLCLSWQLQYLQTAVGGHLGTAAPGGRQQVSLA